MTHPRPRTLYVVATRHGVAPAALEIVRHESQRLEQGERVTAYTSQVALRKAMVRRGLNRRDYRVVTFRIVGGW